MIKTVGLTILVTFSLICASQAQTEWLNQYNQAQHAYNEDNVDEAYDLAKKSISGYMQESGEMNSNYRSILRLLSTLASEVGEFESGIEYAQKEIAVLEQMAAPKDLTYAGALYNLGVMYQQMEKNDDAAVHLNQTLELFKLYYSAGDEEMVNCQWKLASVKFAQGKNDESAQLFATAFEAFGNLEEITMDYLMACYYYGNLLMETGEDNNAVEYLGNVKSIYENSGYEDSEEYMNVVASMASAYRSIDKLKAEEMYELATSKYKLLGMTDMPAYGNLVNNRAVNLQQLGKSAEAEELLSNGSGTNGSADQVVSSLNNLAALSQQRGDLKKAEKLYLEALNIVEDKQSVSYAEVLENLALVYSSTGRLIEAKENLNKSNTIILALYGAEHERYASTIRKQAQIERLLNNHDKSEEYYKLAMAIADNSGTTSLLSLQAANGLAVLYKELGRYKEADKLFEETVTKAKSSEFKGNAFYAIILNNQAALKEIMGEHLQARNLLQESLGVSEAVGNTSGSSYLGTLENLSAIYIELGEYDKARSILERSKQLIEKNLGTSSPAYAANILKFGKLEQAMGQYPVAEPHFKQALELSKQNFGENHPEYARALNAMALFYQLLGNLGEAEPLLLEGASIYEKTYGKSHPEYITTIENLSSLYQIQGENEKAMPLLQEALKMDAEVYGKEHPVYATTLHNLASLYQRLERLDKAEPLFEEALHIDERVYGKRHRSYANTLYNLGTLYQDLNKFDEAERAYSEALEIRKQILGENHPDYAYSMYGLASLFHGTKQFNKASEYYIQVIDKYIQQIEEYFPSMSEKEKSAFYSKIKPVFDAYFDFCVEYQLFEKRSSGDSPMSRMYDLQLSTKALLLNTSNKVRDRILSSGNEEIIANYREWISMKERLVKYLNYSQDELVGQNIEQLKTKANELEKKLSTQSSVFSEQFEKEKIGWNDVRDKLEENAAAVEIIRVAKRFETDSVMYVALIVSKNTINEPELIILKNGAPLENRLFNFYRNAIKFSVGNDISYNSYWKPIGEKIKNIERVYLSADGIYNKINVNTLWDPDSELSVIDELDIRLVSNTRELVEVKPLTSQSDENTAEIFGFPDFNLGFEIETVASNSLVRTTGYGFSNGISDLPGTKVEVESIDQYLLTNNWKRNVNIGVEANEVKFKKIASPKLLHIASHGFFMNDLSFDDREQNFESSHNDLNANPLLRSGVLLTGSAKAIINNERSGEEDGIVTAYEAMNLNLDNTELVVLSACETGLGEVRNGEGVYGLQRSFIVAGAENVIMSLWKVNDVTTQELMSGFYSRWLGGMDKFEAFKEAQLEIKTKYDDPYHWGAFILLGK